MPVASLVRIDEAAFQRGESDECAAHGGKRRRKRGDAVQLHGRCFLSAVAAIANHAPFWQDVIEATRALRDAHELRARPLRRWLILGDSPHADAARVPVIHTRV